MTKITDPHVRPYAQSPGQEVLCAFARACDQADLEVAAHAMHELTHRKLWETRKSAIIKSAISNFQMLSTAYSVSYQFKSNTVGSKNIYVILLRNAKSLEAQHGLYVGMTGLSPEYRFLKHLNGHKSSKHVRNNGVCLLPILYEKLNSISDSEARQIEYDLKKAFENAGILSFGGH